MQRTIYKITYKSNRFGALRSRLDLRGGTDARSTATSGSDVPESGIGISEFGNTKLCSLFGREGVGSSKSTTVVSVSSDSVIGLEPAGANCFTDTVVSLPSGRRTYAYCGLASNNSTSSVSGSYLLRRTLRFIKTGPGSANHDGIDSPHEERRW